MDSTTKFSSKTRFKTDVRLIRERDFKYELIKELTNRGILNSIVSKNDLQKAKSKLVELEVWDYFRAKMRLRTLYRYNLEVRSFAVFRDFIFLIIFLLTTNRPSYPILYMMEMLVSHYYGYRFGICF